MIKPPAAFDLFYALIRQSRTPIHRTMHWRSVYWSPWPDQHQTVNHKTHADTRASKPKAAGGALRRRLWSLSSVSQQKEHDSEHSHSHHPPTTNESSSGNAPVFLRICTVLNWLGWRWIGRAYAAAASVGALSPSLRADWTLIGPVAVVVVVLVLVVVVGRRPVTSATVHMYRQDGVFAGARRVTKRSANIAGTLGVARMGWATRLAFFG